MPRFDELDRWLAKREKAAEREQLKGEWLLDVWEMCVRTGRPMPPHCATNLCDRLVLYRSGRIESFEEAFDIQKPTSTERQYRRLVIPITASVVKRYKKHQSVNWKMFEDIADEFGEARRAGGKLDALSASKVKEIYERGLQERFSLLIIFDQCLPGRSLRKAILKRRQSRQEKKQTSPRSSGR